MGQQSDGGRPDGTGSHKQRGWGKGHIPWNKGKHAGGRRFGNERGRTGFQPRPVLVLGQDGSILRRFPSVKSAAEAFGLKSAHSVSKACQGKFYCRGFRLMYEEEYKPWGDYRNRRSGDRDINGRLVKGHHANDKMRRKSEETMRKIRSEARTRATAMVNDPGNRFGEGVKKPVVCVDTGERFDSLKAAAEHFGIPLNQISMAIKRHGRCHGLAFKYEL